MADDVKTQNQPDYTWPEPEQRSLIGKRISRVDGPVKVSGRAKYTSDVKRPGMLYGKVLRSPYAHARVKSIDTSAAEAMPGVKAVLVIQAPGAAGAMAEEGKAAPGEVQWALDEIAAVAAVDEPTAEDAVRAIKVEYEPLPHLVDDYHLDKAGASAKPMGEQKEGDPDKAMQEAEVVS